MTKLFEHDTRLEAWLAATEFLLESGNALNVILSINDPTSDGPHAAAAHDRIDTYLRGTEKPSSLHSVAETIFPGWEYKHRGIDGVYETYAEQDYPSIKQPGRWGTYAYRLVRRTAADGSLKNPLKILIEKMKSEKGKAQGTLQACYELGVAEGEYDLPLYSTTDDDAARIGGPCLSHLSFKLVAGAVHLTALYRSHYYLSKAFGNLLGLARLQACVAREIGGKSGTLVCHSTYAHADGKKRDAQALIADLRSILNGEPSDVAR